MTNGAPGMQRLPAAMLESMAAFPATACNSESSARFAALINEQPAARTQPNAILSQEGFDQRTQPAEQAIAPPYFMHRAISAQVGEAPAPQTIANNDIADLLQRLCSAVYVGEESSPVSSRMMLALDAALPGAAVEFIRDGAFLQIRLLARNDSTFRLMSTRRDSLHATVADATRLNVTVEVVRDEGVSDGSAY